ncbi:MAG: NusA-like transcription termination signal-binding factor [Thermofilaceae archaeon]
MAGVKLTENELQHISIFEAITQVEALDCILDEDDNRVIFVVRKGTAGKAIGSNGTNVRTLRQVLRREIDIVEKGETLEELVSSALFPAAIRSIEVKKDNNGRSSILVEVPFDQKGLAIGKGGRNVRRAKLLIKRYFGIDNLVLK